IAPAWSEAWKAPSQSSPEGHPGSAKRAAAFSRRAVHVADLAAEPPLDVTDRAALDELAARIDRLDILINAAGVLTENKPVDELAPDDFRKNFEVNLLGTLQACQAFGPLLRIRRGAVVNVA